MTIYVGQTVYYFGRGPCLVSELVSKVVCGASAKFYRFVLLGERGEEFLVPAANAASLPLRALTPFNKLPELLRRLQSRSGPPRNAGSWRERESLRAKVFASGSAFELCDYIEAMSRSSSLRKLAADEWEALRRARKLLIAEIAAVTGQSLSAAESRIDAVLKPAQQTANPTSKGTFVCRRESRR